MAESVGSAETPMLRSERVFLRPVERDDLSVSVEWFSDPEFTEGLNGRAPMSQTAAESWFEETRPRHGTSLWHSVVCLREDGRPIGLAALISVDHVNGSSELIIGIGDRSCRDVGYGTETVRVLLDFAFGELALHRVFLRVFDYNERARHVYERVGFSREDCYRHGRYHDTHVMGILRDEWAAQEWSRSWERD